VAVSGVADVEAAMARTVLVTGATAGFGAAIARRFAARGDRVVVTGRRVERLDALVAELGDGVLARALDVRDGAAVRAMIEALPSEFADIDVLVNNAGLALGLEPAWRTDLDDWETMVDTNCKGAMYLIRAVLPGMVARGRGHVVNLSSIAATHPYPGGNVYGASKAFLTQLSANLRADLVGHPIRVTDIEPGLAETEFSLVRFKGDAGKAADPYRGVQPLTAEDIAEAVVWAVDLPPHVNISRIEVMPTMQADGPLRIARDGGA
jgi:3-hydroxy acid dehydrogenase/malonic semialdehyde reductase